MNEKARERTIWLVPSIVANRDGSLPICSDPAGVCLMSDVQALDSETDVNPQPLRTFGNTATQVWFRNWRGHWRSRCASSFTGHRLPVRRCKSTKFFLFYKIFMIIYGHLCSKRRICEICVRFHALAICVVCDYLSCVKSISHKQYEIQGPF